MNNQSHIDMTPAHSTGMELVTIPKESALAIFTTPDALDPFLAKIRAQIDEFKPDISTAKGRDKIKSMAFKVAQSKTYLEGVGKELAAQAKQIPGKIDAARKSMRETLDGWRDEVRAPLTQWEQADEKRIAAHRSELALLQSMASKVNEAGNPYTAESLAGFLAIAEGFAIGPRLEEFEVEFARAKDATIAALRANIAARLIYESEQAELAELRRKEVERAAIDKAEAEELARKAAIQVEADAIARRAIEEAERNAERQAKEAHDAAIAAEQREKALVEQAKAAEQRAADTEARIKRETAEAKAIEEADMRRRERSIEHRAKINRAAMVDLIDGGLDEPSARLAVRMIAMGKITAISIEY